MASSETASVPSSIDFSNTQIAFANKSNRDLKQTAWLFALFNKPWFVKAGGAFGLWLHDAGIHLFDPLIKVTVFRQFCGGTSLADCENVVEHLWQNKTLTILDYGAEGKSRESDFEHTMSENLRAIAFASVHPGVPVISTKVTALGSIELLEKRQSSGTLTSSESAEFERIRTRLHTICKTAMENGVAVFIDAEESWIQQTIDDLVKEMMEAYNRHKVVVYHTYQLYRKDKLEGLKSDFREAQEKGYLLGAKLVRGAYMEKERERAKDHGYASPIQDTKEDTDNDFNRAVTFCVEHFEKIASCNGSHNWYSNQLQAELIMQKGIRKDHPHLNFCQLYGMSDNITFNLAHLGFNVAKYVPYGPVGEVIPYLIRRAQENSSVTGEMSRELSLIDQEMKRRGLK